MLAPDINVLLRMAERVGENSLTGGPAAEQARAESVRQVGSSTGRRSRWRGLLEFEIPGPAAR